jgi:hypothetical protein
MTYAQQELYNSLTRIARAIIGAKPREVKGTAQYHSQTYTDMDAAWDWFENDLETVYRMAEESLGEHEAQRLRKELEPVL